MFFLLAALLFSFGLGWAEKASPTRSLSLEDAVALALKMSPALRMSQSEVAAASARGRGARSEALPKIAATGALLSADMPGILSTSPAAEPGALLPYPDAGSSDLNVGLMLPLYTGSRIGNSIRAAEARIKAASQDDKQRQVEVAALVRILYLEASFRNESRGVRKDILALTEEQGRLSQVLFDAGKIPKFYFLRAKNEVSRSKRELNESEAGYDVALAALRETIGLSQNEQLSLSEPFTPNDFSKTKDDCRNEALSERPDLKSLEHRLEAARAELKAAGGAYAPQVYGGAMYDWRNKQSGNEKGYSLSVIAGIPLFDAGLRKSKIQELSAEVGKEEAERDALRLAVDKDIAQNFSLYGAARKNVDLADDSVTEAQEIYRISRLRYDSGKGLYVEVQEALSNLARSRLEKLESVLKCNTALFELKRSLGQK
ncbi:MAG: TolC family protein [bacterium]